MIADTRAIVHVPSVSDGEARVQILQLRPFARFLYKLTSGQPEEVTTNLGMATWNSFPVERMMADGIWPVMVKLSKKHGFPLKTERQVLDATHHTEFLLNTGLTICYKSIEEAADAFRQEIRESLESTLHGLSRKESILTQALWQLPVARFFARLIKAAQDCIAEVSKEAERLMTLNEWNIGRSVEITEWSKELSEDAMVESYLQWNGVRSPNAYKGFRNARSRLREIREEIALFASLPYRLNKLPEEVTVPDISLKVGWVETQLLLAAADLPDREYLEQSELAPAHEAIKAKAGEEVIASFLERMQERGAKLGPEKNEALLPHLMKRVQVLKGETNPLRELKPAEPLFHFIRPNEDVPTYSRLLRKVESSGVKGQRAQFVASLLLNTPWDEINLNEFRRLVMDDELPSEVLAERILDMQEDLRKSAAAHLIKRAPSPGAFATLAEAGLIDPTLGVFHSQWKVLPIDWLVKNFPLYMEALDEQENYVGFMNIFMRLPDREARRLLKTPEWREKVTWIITNICEMARSTLLDKDNPKILPGIRRKLGPELATRYALANLIIDRENYCFVELPEHDEEFTQIHPWEKMADDGVPQGLALLGLSQEKLKKLLKRPKFSERASYMWLYETSESREGGFSEYERLRDDFFRRQQESMRSKRRKRPTRKARPANK